MKRVGDASHTGSAPPGKTAKPSRLSRRTPAGGVLRLALWTRSSPFGTRLDLGLDGAEPWQLYYLYLLGEMRWGFPVFGPLLRKDDPDYMNTAELQEREADWAAASAALAAPAAASAVVLLVKSTEGRRLVLLLLLQARNFDGRWAPVIPRAIIITKLLAACCQHATASSTVTTRTCASWHECGNNTTSFGMAKQLALDLDEHVTVHSDDDDETSELTSPQPAFLFN